MNNRVITPLKVAHLFICLLSTYNRMGSKRNPSNRQFYVLTLGVSYEHTTFSYASNISYVHTHNSDDIIITYSTYYSNHVLFAYRPTINYYYFIVFSLSNTESYRFELPTTRLRLQIRY